MFLPAVMSPSCLQFSGESRSQEKVQAKVSSQKEKLNSWYWSLSWQIVLSVILPSFWIFFLWAVASYY